MDTWSEVAANTRDEVGSSADGWIAATPGAIRELSERWHLTLGDPFPAETVAYVLPATLEDGARAVLRLLYPNYGETSFRQEVAGLRVWDGRGIVRLLAWDEEAGAQLLERAEPGTSLLEEPDELRAIEIAGRVLHRMWSAPVASDPAIRTLAEQAAIWAEAVEPEWHRAGKPFERELVTDARDTLLALAEGSAPAAERVLVHGDLHHGNVLAAGREPWLAIDPKPMVGERSYDVRAPVCDRREELLADDDPLKRLRSRLRVLTEELDVDPGRSAAWAFAVEVTWCIEGLASGGEHAAWSRNELAVARLLREIRG